MAYELEGSLLEVCDCNVLCLCWIGEDPDNGTCQSALAYHIDKGSIDGIDVSGLNYAVAVFIPGNVLAGNWRAVRFIDDRATPEQEAVLLAVFRGEKGGPLADLAQLVGEEKGARRAPITFKRSCGLPWPDAPGAEALPELSTGLAAPQDGAKKSRIWVPEKPLG